MTTRGKRSMVTGVALALLVAGMPLDAVAKKKEKPVLSATVNGKRFKVRKRVFLTAGGGTIGFLVMGTKGGKLLGVSCAVLFYGQPLPFTSTDCLTQYDEIKGLRVGSQKSWKDIVDGSTSVTFEEYDGVRIAGRFHAVVPGFSSPDLPTLTIDGEFHGPFQPGDPTN